MALLLLEGTEPPIIQDQDIRLREASEALGVRPVRPSQGELVEQPRHTTGLDTVPLAAGVLSQRRCDVALADTSLARQGDIEVVVNPGAGSELADDGLVQSALGTGVDVFDAGVVNP